MSEAAERSSGAKEGVSGAVGGVREEDGEIGVGAAGEGVLSVLRKAAASGFVRTTRGISSRMEEKVRLCSIRLYSIERDEAH